MSALNHRHLRITGNCEEKLRSLRCPHWSGLRRRPFADSWVIFPMLVVSCSSLVFLCLLGRAQFESGIGRNF